MRIYLPATIPVLAQARDRGVFEGRHANAVTPMVREWYVDDDVEDLEFTALLDAARSSLALLGRDPEAPRLRLVVAADVPDADVSLAEPGNARAEKSAVRLAAPIPLKAVVSLHIDESTSEAIIRAAARALPAAEAGDDDAEFAVSQAEGCDLLWYDISELDDLLG
jgi:hypothetical protein